MYGSAFHALTRYGSDSLLLLLIIGQKKKHEPVFAGETSAEVSFVVEVDRSRRRYFYVLTCN